jgi:hypothetical protein
MHHDGREMFRFVQGIAAVHTNLIQLKQSTDSLWISLPGEAQQLAPLIHLFFFSMGGWTSFHLRRISFAETAAKGRSGFIIHYFTRVMLESLHKHWCFLLDDTNAGDKHLK